MNWVWYIPAAIVFGLLLWQLILQHRLAHGSIPKSKRKGPAETLFWITLFAFVGSKVVDFCKDYQNAQEGKGSKQVITNLVARTLAAQETVAGLRLQVTNLTLGLQEFTDVFETNNSVASPVRLGKLAGEEKVLAQKQLELSQKVQKMNSIEAPDLKTLREARTIRYTLRETEKQQAEIQRRKSEIVKKETGEQLAENFRGIETHLTEQCLSVFDDVIGILFHQLVIPSAISNAA